MPQLRSGRHVSIHFVDLAEKIKFGAEMGVLALVVEYRLRVRSAKDLLDLMPVLYYRETDQTPPHAPAYDSGHSVRQILDGNSDWSIEEIGEFQHWLDSNQALNDFFKSQFVAIHNAIVASLLWDSELVSDEPELGRPN